ncbi:MAG: hypothetical protein HYY16_12365 [Planctomycetes bacterium]|nr:hypothetical protein [Planctomycetota bacterium]
MDCEATREALSAAEGRPLPAPAEAHLTSCAPCRAWAMALERLPERLAEWRALEPPDDFDARLLIRVRGGRRARRIAQAAAFLLGALAGFAGARLSQAPPPVPVAVEPALDVTDDYIATYSREPHR